MYSVFAGKSWFPGLAGHPSPFHVLDLSLHSPHRTPLYPRSESALPSFSNTVPGFLVLLASAYVMV